MAIFFFCGAESHCCNEFFLGMCCALTETSTQNRMWWFMKGLSTFAVAFLASCDIVCANNVCVFCDSFWWQNFCGISRSLRACVCVYVHYALFVGLRLFGSKF